jgi:hypothetical protein
LYEHKSIFIPLVVALAEELSPKNIPRIPK